MRFFHLPDEWLGEVTEAGFELVELVAVEGPGWLARDFDRIWSIPQQRDRLLAALRKVEHQPALLGASSHILASGGSEHARSQSHPSHLDKGPVSPSANFPIAHADWPQWINAP